MANDAGIEDTMHKPGPSEDGKAVSKSQTTSASFPVENPSYRRAEPFVVTEEVRAEIAGAIAELDMAQLAIQRRLTPAQRVQQAASMIDAVERVTAYRLRARRPELTADEALYIIRRGLMRHTLQQRQK